MPIQKYIDRLIRMDELIRRKATGSPDEFAEKLKINRSTLMRSLAELRFLGAPVNFDTVRQTYYYEKEGDLVFGFKVKAEHFGGVAQHLEEVAKKEFETFSKKFGASHNMRLSRCNLASS